MKLYVYVTIIFVALLFYGLGVFDQENHSVKGMIIWVVVSGVVGVWLLATWWATRGE